MVLALLLLGIVVGSVAAGAWIYAGGSLLLAVVIYTLVGTMLALGSALLWYFLLERKASEMAKQLQAAE